MVDAVFWLVFRYFDEFDGLGDFRFFDGLLNTTAWRAALAMVSFLMVQDELKSGQLHAPYGFIRDGSSYCLLSPQALDQDEKCARFKHGLWLRQLLASLLSVASPAGGACRPSVLIRLV